MEYNLPTSLKPWWADLML